MEEKLHGGLLSAAKHGVEKCAKAGLGNPLAERIAKVKGS